MRRRRAARAEVFARLDEAAAEELLPRAIDRDARCQRVRLVDKPTGETKSVGHQVVAKRGQHSRHARVDRLARVGEIAAAADHCRWPLVRNAFAHHERRGDGERFELIRKMGASIACRLQQRRDRAVERREVLLLLLRTIRRRDRQNRPKPRGNPDNLLRILAGCGRQPEAADGLSDRAAAMHETNAKPRGDGQRLREHEDDLTRQTRRLAAGIDPASRLPLDRMLRQPRAGERDRQPHAGRTVRPPQHRQRRRPRRSQLPLHHSVRCRRAPGRTHHRLWPL